MKKTGVGAFNDLFEGIKSALNEEKTYFLGHSKGPNMDTWLKKPHSQTMNMVNGIDPYMWLTFWLDDIWVKSQSWNSLIWDQSSNSRKNTGVLIRDPNKSCVLQDLPEFKENPLTCGEIGNIYIKKFRDAGTFDSKFINYATWFLFNEFYSEGDNGNLVSLPEEDSDNFYKAALVLWHKYYSLLIKSIKDTDVDSFLASLDIKWKHHGNNIDTVDGLLSHYDLPEKLPDDTSYRKKCDEAANLFWSQVRAALKTLEVKPIIPCIFTIGGNTMNTPTYDAFTIFNSNPVYQKCRAVLMEDQPLVESGKPGKVMETCSSAELLSYLSFFNTLANFEDKDIQVFCTYLGDDFARAVNNPTVQKEVIFKNREMLSGLTGLYLRYILRVYMNEKYEAVAAHSSEHEFLKKIPLIRFSLNDSAAAHEFIEKNEVTATIHKYGDCYGTFRLRYAGESDIDNILSIQNADGSDDKNIFIRAGETEIRRALLNRQLFVVEDMHMDVDINAKATRFNNGKSKSETENPLAAFAILCSDILPYSENGEAGTANYNGKIIERLETLGYSRNDYSSFNTNFVAKDYRGYGLQRLFLRLLSELSANAGKSGVVCTVSANNKVSYDNFERAGYEKISDVNYVFDGVEYHRDFLMLKLK